MSAFGRKLGAVIVCVLLVTTAVGCRQVAKKAVEQATGVKVDEDNASVTIKTETGEATIEGGDGLPKGFPSSVPVYSGTIESGGSLASEGSDVYSVTIMTKDDVSKVKQFYESKLAAGGWKIAMTLDSGSGDARNVMIGAEKGDLQLNVAISVRSGEGTQVGLVVGSKE
ncbi:MAG: hypothetical protein N3B11_05825 [Coriobacteriia bacterium]|nr:hypothetical protein [Coriobacteriia bacterium]